jgi:hypothetical protein
MATMRRTSFRYTLEPTPEQALNLHGLNSADAGFLCDLEALWDRLAPACRCAKGMIATA